MSNRPVALPEWRPAPPWVMEDMIRREPDLVDPILSTPEAAPIAGAVEEAARAGRAVVVTGCGTSEHAAHALALLLREALGPGRRGLVHACQALEYALDPWPAGLLIAVSHEGETKATVSAMARAHAVGATVALVTAVSGSPAGTKADLVYATPLVDQSWCHTVGYLSPLLAGAALWRALGGGPLEAVDLKDTLRRELDRADGYAAAWETLQGAERLVAVGSGADWVTAREFALKIEEGVRRPAVARHLETLLHGHLAAADGRTGVVVFLLDARHAGRAERTLSVLAAVRELGLPLVAVVAEEALAVLGERADGLSHLTVAEAVHVPAAVNALVTGALALQQLTLAGVRMAGVNPDRIRREEEPHRRAAEAASATWPAGLDGRRGDGS